MSLASKISRRLTSDLRVSSRLQSTVAAESGQDVSEEYARAKPYSQIPSPRGLPFLGNTLDVAKTDNQVHAVKYHTGLIKQLGPIYVLRTPALDMVCIADAEYSKTLLNSDHRWPINPGFELLNRIRTKHLKHLFPSPGLMSDGEDWYNFRSQVQQDMMRPKSAMFYIDDLSEIMDEVIDKIESMVDDKRETEITNMLYEFALDAVGLMFIGSKLGVLQGSPFGKEMITKVNRILQLIPQTSFLPERIAKYVPIFKEVVKLIEDVTIMSGEKVNQALEKHKVDGSLEGTILDKLVQRCGPDSKIPHIMANDALFAGMDTTGNTAAFLLYHLATNMDKQEKLYEEILRVVGKDGKMTESALTDMRYLKACQTESQRIAPVILGTIRAPVKDMVLGGYQIPKGTFVLRLGLNSTQEQHFKDPEKFLPERWLRGSPEHQKVDNPFANIPFGHGPRACIGQRFARLELYMVAFKLLRKYRISYNGPPIGVNYHGLGHPTGPLKLKFEKRD